MKTKNNNLIEYLIPENYLEDDEISIDLADEIYASLCNILINQFNKLRDHYKEIYLHLKTKAELELPQTPLFLKIKKKLNKYLFKK